VSIINNDTMWSMFQSNKDGKKNLKENLMDQSSMERGFRKVQSELDSQPTGTDDSSSAASEEELDDLSHSTGGTWFQTQEKLNQKSRKILEAKAWAEEGPLVVRYLGATISFSLAVTIIVMCFLESPNTTDIGLMVCTVWLCALLFFLDYRETSGNQDDGRAKKVRRILQIRLKPLKYMWGRGTLCMMTGSLQMIHMWKIALISGGVMVGYGFILFLVGWWKFFEFRNLPKTLDGLLWSEYTRCTMDSNGRIKASEFSNLLVEIGFHVDDYLTIREFNMIDKNKDQKISFYEFKDWFSRKYRNTEDV